MTLYSSSIHSQNQEDIGLADNKFESLLEAMQDGVVVLNSEGKIIDHNKAALTILGVTSSELLDMTVRDPKWKLIREDFTDLPRDEYPAEVARKSGKAISNQTLGLYNLKNNLRWLSVSTVPLKNKSEEIIQVLVGLRDVTDEKVSREKLEVLKSQTEQREKFLNNMLNAIPSLISYWNQELKNVHSNQAFADFHGIDLSKLKGKHAQEILGSEIYEINLPHMLAALKGAPQVFEREIQKSGKTIHNLVTVVPNRGKNNKVEGIFVMVTDISKVKKLEAERREIEAKLITASKMSLLGEMAAGIAHEINNPLAIINGRATLLRISANQGTLGQEVLIREIGKIESTVERIATIIQGLRSFARDADQDPMVVADLDQIIFDTLELCQEKIKNNGVEIRITPFEKVRIMCRSVQISQIILNILTNAYDAVKNLGERWISIHSECSGDRVKVFISDSGKGIPPSIVEKMMQPFFTTKDIGRGTGLGLSISKGLAEGNGGTLKYLENTPNTCFVLEFPIFEG